ncbi:MAG TPA: DoxX family protein [Solirubrobacteraceae bacterium]|nr:DoxX family protein [Solirubrobacteraceae bacterium]
MFAAYLAVVISTLVVNTWAAAADLLRAQFVLANSAEVGVDEGWLPWLGGLKAAGAVGLLVGLLWLRPIGIAAAIGLTFFFIGAIATHVRARVLYNLAFPGFFLALAVGSLVLTAVR